jgi:CheY-like chemotaxis protein
MPDGGTLSVEVVLKEPHELESVPLLKAECYAVVTFTDTGRGMNEDVLKSAFEPFFTTKEIELGRGLGLPMVRKVASDHGGTVQLWSETDVGTTLRIVLPVAEVEDRAEDEGISMAQSMAPSRNPGPSDSITRPIDATSMPSPALKTQRRVLLAEDDEALGRAFVRSLRRAGYEVVWVADGERASAALANPAASFDLVLLDLDIADGSGPRAHTLIRKREPDMPVVLLSGTTEAENADAAAQLGHDTLVHKPVEPAVLARVVQLALRRAGRGSRP